MEFKYSCGARGRFRSVCLVCLLQYGEIPYEATLWVSRFESCNKRETYFNLAALLVVKTKANASGKEIK